MRNDLKTIGVYNSPAEDVINLANNENYYSAWNNILNSELKQQIDDVPLFSYGPSIHSNVIDGYAKYVNIKSEHLLVAPGSDGLVPLLVNALSTKKILTLENDFFRYDQIAKILYRENIKIKQSEHCYDDIIEVANNEDVELIIISNPNNPLGILHNQENLLKILDNTSCYVVIDEAYYEYLGESIIDFIDKYDKLLILRTLSKAWGLAGLRIGFVLANANLIQYLLAVQGPFTLSPLNAAIAASILEHPEVKEIMVSNTIREREKFIEFLKNYQIEKIYDSHTNFVYFDVQKAQEIKNLLLNDKIAVNFFQPNSLRVSIGTEEQMTLLREKLSQYLTKQGE